jgi:23S rRNA pseudouridine1911/1915/1917 synthase
MAKPNRIELPDGTVIPILHEDRSLIAIDKPPGWMLVPYNWDKTSRNLHLAISASILARAYWARSRNLRYLRHVHRLDADTSGILLLAKSPGALQTYSRLFASRQMEKKYLAVVDGVPIRKCWTCRLKIGPDPHQAGHRKIDACRGKEAETHFRVLASKHCRALIEARPVTGRTHQIRLHLMAAGHPVIGDPLYGSIGARTPHRPLIADPASPILHPCPLALRAVSLAYRDPFQGKPVRIEAPSDEFRQAFGFAYRSRASG